MTRAKKQPPRGLYAVKGDAVPLTSEHRKLIEVFVDYLRRLPELKRNAEGVEMVGTAVTAPYHPLIALMLNHFSARDFATRDGGTQASYSPFSWSALPEEIRTELWEWIKAARCTDALSERRRRVLDAEYDRRRAGEMWNWYVEGRRNLGLKPAKAPWNVDEPIVEG